MLARFCQRVLHLSQAYHALFLAVFVIVSIRVETIGLLNCENTTSSDDFLLHQAGLWRKLVVKLDVNDALKGVGRVCRVLTDGMHYEREVLLTPITLVGATSEHLQIDCGVEIVLAEGPSLLLICN